MVVVLEAMECVDWVAFTFEMRYTSFTDFSCIVCNLAISHYHISLSKHVVLLTTKPPKSASGHPSAGVYGESLETDVAQLVHYIYPIYPD